VTAAAGPLDAVARRAGAVTVERQGARIPAHYGSAAGELAVCLRAVGIADRSDLGKLVVTGRPEGVAELVRRAAGSTLAVTGVAAAGGAWWCAAAPDRLLVLTEPAKRLRTLELLRAAARPLGGVRVADASTALSAIAVLGRHSLTVLAALEALGAEAEPRSVPPVAEVRLAGADVVVLLQSDRRALLVLDAVDADRVWRAVEEAGRPFGISYVGIEAVERFSLLDPLR
jgi:glycine cleavage system aminomethyltransferase T